MMTKSILRATAAWQAVALLGAGATTAFVAAVPAAAQDISSGEISGVVQDASGNPVPNATVTLTSTERGITRTTVTGTGGIYRFTGLPLANYNLSATSPTGSGQVTDAAAGLGGAAYTITVGAAAGDAIVVTGRRARALDFSQTATGAVFDVQEVAERVPVARTLESVALLAPQVVVGDQTFSADYPGGTISLGGSSIAENIYYINGLNVTNFRTFIGGSTVPFEFYDQVQVKTGGYQAEFGRSTGGALIAVSRSGSNEFQGGLNAYWSPEGLRKTSPDTYQFLNKNDRVTDAEGNIWASGPLIKDRAYFFGFFNPRYYSSYGENLTRTTRATLKRKTPFYGGKLDFDITQGHRLELTYFNDSNRDITDQDAYLSDGTTFSRNTKEYDFTGGSNMIGRYTGQFTDWLTLSLMHGRSKYQRITNGTDASVPYTLEVAPTGPGTPARFIQGIGALLDNGEDERRAWRADVDVFANFLGSHRIRFGADYEKLTANNVAGYSGGEINYFYTNWNSTPTSFGIAPGEKYLRRIVYLSSGEFENQNTAFYIQDNWEVNDRLQLSLGIRNDRFRNLGLNGVEFVDIKNQWAPRLGATYDVFGDRNTRVQAFWGRYYLPIAANTNLRMAGQEQYFEDIYRYTGTFTNYTIQGPSLRNIVYSNSTDPDPTTLVDKDLKPQFMDEMIFGVDHRFRSGFLDGWNAGINITRRNLKSVLEDTDAGLYAIGAFCSDNPEACGGETYLDVGSGGYILVNPGSDATINVSPQGGWAGGELTIPAEYLDLPKGKRKYTAVEFSFDKPWDGAWMLGGSYVWSKNKGNYEGGVKSDNGQDDVGLTQDFDEPGWMDGAYGYLPNDRRHQFKLYGAYQVTPRFRVGANGRLVSGRPFGCMGIYNFDDGRAVTSAYDSWYCGDRSQAVDTDGDGQVDQAPTILAGRGNAFRGEWEKRVDLNFTYDLPLAGLKSVQLRADIFNIFNFDSPIDYNEYGDEDTSPLANGNVPLNVNYRKPTNYQTPRYVRFGVSIGF